MWNLGWNHCEAVKDVIRYLKGTVDLTLTLGGSDKGLKAYANADWASQPHRHLMSSYTVLLHSSPVAWSTRKQTIIALSTAKAEYIALTMVMHKILYFQALIAELYEPVIPPILVYCDNQGALALATNNKFHAHTKHINIQYHYVRYMVRSVLLDLQYCPMEDNIADIFTKALPRP
jgi:hypothetical protein